VGAIKGNGGDLFDGLTAGRDGDAGTMDEAPRIMHAGLR